MASAWLVGFLVFFYSLTPPNNPSFKRYELWQLMPAVLLDTVDPSEVANAPLSGWRFFPQRFDLLIIAAVMMAGAWAWGHLLLRLVNPPLPSRCVERTVFAFGLGLSALSLTTLLCGLVGALSCPLLGGLIVVAVVAEIALRLRRQNQRGDATRSNRLSWKLPHRMPREWLLPLFCLAAMVPFLLSMFLGAMLPSTDFDVKEYHLQGPKEFFQSGQISFLPHNVYTSFPFLTEMLSLLAMVLRGDWYRGALAGKAVLMCFAPLTGLALFAAGRRWFGPTAGWLAVTVYLTTPWIFRISIIAYAEGGLSFYLFASLLTVMIGIEKLRRGETPGKQFLLTGLLAGSAMACKYTGLVSAVIPLGAVVCLAPLVLRAGLPDKWRAVLSAGAAFAIGTVLTIGPWLLKNTVETGNPVYPLMYSWFGGRDWDAELNEKWRAGHSPKNYTDLPERVLEVTAGNDWLSPLLFGLAPLSLFALGRHSVIRAVWVYALWLFLTWWLFTHRLDRFWVPMIPAVALLAGIGAAKATGRIWRYTAGPCFLAALLFNLVFVVSGASGYNAFLIDLDEPRRSVAPPGIAFLNDKLSPNSRVLMVGEAQVFDARFPLVYNTVFDRSIFEEWFANPEPNVPSGQWPLHNADAIRQKLHKEQITHILVNWAEILRYRARGSYGYTDFVTPERFAALVRMGILLPNPITANQEFRKLSDKQQRRELETWAPVLKISVDGESRFVIWQVFAVRRPGAEF